MTQRARFLIAGLALVAAACGGDRGSSTEPDPATPSSSAIPVPSSAPDSSVPVGPAPTDGSPTSTTPGQLRGLGLEAIAEGLDTPVFLASLPGDSRLFVVEKPGRIRVVGGAAGDDVFLDLESLTGDDHQEQGLLGMAFHPGYAENGRFFVHYTDTEGTSTLAEYAMSLDDPDRADPDSGRVLLVQGQPARNHNGGMIAFGPDGYLYLALGDGGGAGDRYRNGQRTDTLLGSILRLDVDGGEPYAIPAGNPFATGGGAGEVWAFGLRNPWRFSFDGDLMYLADVGQDKWEEIDVLSTDAAGLNLGWPIVEGDECFGGSGCDTDGLTGPVLVYSHSEGCSVTGGYVYRGAAIPELAGHYFYGDWCGGWVRSFRYEDGEISESTDWSSDLGRLDQIVSFGRGGFGEIYVLLQRGVVFKIVPVR